MTIKTAAFRAEPDDFALPEVPVVVIAATGHDDVNELLAWMRGETGPTGQILDAGEELEYQTENPGRGAAAWALLMDAKTGEDRAHDLLEDLRARAANQDLSSTGYAKLARDWAHDAVTAPGGMADRFPLLGIPADPHADEPHDVAMNRHYATFAMTWALRILEVAEDSQTTAVLDALLARRATRIADRGFSQAMVVAA